MSRKKTPPPEGALTRRDRLQAELRAAVEQIDEEGLVFLLEQANVLLHNSRVEELEAKRRARGKSAEQEEGAPEVPRRPPVELEESADRKTFFLSVGGQRKVLSLGEMQQLVRICHGAESAAEAARRLHTVLARERRDILMDGGIAGASSPLLVALAELIRSRYRPRPEDSSNSAGRKEP